MARGDRREPIFLDEEDCRRFHKLLGELVERTGWEVYAWVAMPNHYHLVFRTPEANLVEGMKWLQNTWTKRFNARHRLWGTGLLNLRESLLGIKTLIEPFPLPFRCILPDQLEIALN